MNKPISSLFVFSVVYCVVFRQTLKKTRQKQTNQKNNKNKTKPSRQKKRNTGHPAHHSAANEYLSGSGWMGCIFVVVVFLQGLCCLLLLEFCSLIHAKAQKDKAKTKKQKKNKKTFEKNNKKQEIEDILQPTTRPRINIFQVPAA